MISADRPLQIDEAKPDLHLVAHGRAAVLESIGKPRKNSRKEGGRSLAITLRFGGFPEERLTLTIPSEHIHERLVEREAFQELEEARQALIAARQEQQRCEAAYALAQAEFPAAFTAIAKRAKANDEEKATAVTLRSRAFEWLNTFEVDPANLPDGLAAKNYNEWRYNREYAVMWAAVNQPGLIVLQRLTEEMLNRIYTDKAAYAAFCTLAGCVPELFAVDDSRLQKLLDGCDHLTRDALEAEKVHFKKAQIASALGVK